MQKMIGFILMAILILGCKKEVQPSNEIDGASQFISFPNKPDLQTLSPEADAILEKWPEFQQLQNSFEVMSRAQNNEDLVLAVIDLLEKEKGLRNSTYPEEFDKLQIKSRQKVMQTFLLKLKASLEDKTGVDEPIKQLMVARNAFRKQFNIVIGNKLDTKLILDGN